MNYTGLTNPVFYPKMEAMTSLSINWDAEFSRVDVKGKGKAVDTDLDEAFSRAAALVHKEQSRIVEVKDGDESLEAAFERTTISGDTAENKEKSEFEK